MAAWSLVHEAYSYKKEECNMELNSYNCSKQNLNNLTQVSKR